MSRGSRAAVVAAVTVLAASAFADDGTDHSTTVSLTTGVGAGSSETGIVLGGTVLQELSSRLSLEAAGSYLDRGRGAEALHFAGSLIFNIRPATEKAVPYIALGGGAYHFSVDREMWDRGGMDMGGRPGMGAMPGRPGFIPPGVWDQMQQWLRQGGHGDERPFAGRTSTSFALNAGGGLRIDVGSHVVLRPDARALVVFGEGGTRTLGVFTLNAGYRF
jgi:hypothetical protein